jgi:hypothetical protein
MPEIVGADMAEAGSMACRGKAFANRRIGDDPVPSGTAVLTYLAPAVVVGIVRGTLLLCCFRGASRSKEEANAHLPNYLQAA